MRFAAVLVCVLALGCVSPVALKSLRLMQSANKGHMDDASISVEARAIGQANYDAAGQVLFNLDGTQLPEDTAARAEARQ